MKTRRAFIFVFPLLIATILLGIEKPIFVVKVQPTEQVYHLAITKPPIPDFKVKYSIENITNQTQKYQLWTGCYGWNWQADNPLIIVGNHACLQNFLCRGSIEPGKQIENQIEIWVDRKAPKGPLEFRIGFQPTPDNGIMGPHDKKLGPFWSNKICIEVAD